MLRLLRHRVQGLLLRCRHRGAQRKVREIERLDLPEELKQAAIRRIQRRFEERLDRFTEDV